MFKMVKQYDFSFPSVLPYQVGCGHVLMGKSPYVKKLVCTSDILVPCIQGLPSLMQGEGTGHKNATKAGPRGGIRRQEQDRKSEKSHEAVV